MRGGAARGGGPRGGGPMGQAPVGQTNTVRVQLPLLDRLIDDDPDNPRDPPQSAAEQAQ